MKKSKKQLASSGRKGTQSCSHPWQRGRKSAIDKVRGNWKECLMATFAPIWWIAMPGSLTVSVHPSSGLLPWAFTEHMAKGYGRLGAEQKAWEVPSEALGLSPSTKAWQPKVWADQQNGEKTFKTLRLSPGIGCKMGRSAQKDTCKAGQASTTYQTWTFQMLGAGQRGGNGSRRAQTAKARWKAKIIFQDPKRLEAKL